MNINLENLSKNYGKNLAVKDINLNLDNGIWGLLGPNGAGKTTLIKMLTTIVRPSDGKISLNGKDIFDNQEKYCDMLGYLPQQFGYIKELSLIDYLEYISVLKGLERNEFEKRSEELLRRFSLYNVRNKKIDEFSGGMKRRAGIIQALLNEPKILILDEPTAGLDIEERRKFRELVTSFSANKLVLISTHIVSDIEFIANNILIMDKGRIIDQVNSSDIAYKIKSHVYEGIIKSEELGQYEANYKLINYHNIDDKHIKIRFLSKDKLPSSFSKESPSLEDYYLYKLEEQFY